MSTFPQHGDRYPGFFKHPPAGDVRIAIRNSRSLDMPPPALPPLRAVRRAWKAERLGHMYCGMLHENLVQVRPTLAGLDGYYPAPTDGVDYVSVMSQCDWSEVEVRAVAWMYEHPTL